MYSLYAKTEPLHLTDLSIHDFGISWAPVYNGNAIHVLAKLTKNNLLSISNDPLLWELGNKPVYSGGRSGMWSEVLHQDSWYLFRKRRIITPTLWSCPDTE